MRLEVVTEETVKNVPSHMRDDVMKTVKRYGNYAVGEEDLLCPFPRTMLLTTTLQSIRSIVTIVPFGRLLWQLLQLLSSLSLRVN